MALFQGKLEEKESTLVFSRLAIFNALHEDMRILSRKTSKKGDNLSMTYVPNSYVFAVLKVQI